MEPYSESHPTGYSRGRPLLPAEMAGLAFGCHLCGRSKAPATQMRLRLSCGVPATTRSSSALAGGHRARTLCATGASNRARPSGPTAFLVAAEKSGKCLAPLLASASRPLLAASAPAGRLRLRRVVVAPREIHTRGRSRVVHRQALAARQRQEMYSRSTPGNSKSEHRKPGPLHITARATVNLWPLR